MSNQKQKQAARDAAFAEFHKEHEAELEARVEYKLITNERDEVTRERDEAIARADEQLEMIDLKTGELISQLRNEKNFTAQKVQAVTGHSTREQKRLMSLVETSKITTGATSDTTVDADGGGTDSQNSEDASSSNGASGHGQ